MAADTVVYAPTLPVQRNRLTLSSRILVGLPVLIINYAMTLVAVVMTIIIWFVAVIVGRTSDDLHSALNLGVSYTGRASAYFWLLTQDWPQITQETSAVTAGSFASETFRAPAAPLTGGSTVPPPPPAAGGASTKVPGAAPPPNPFGE